MGTTASKKEPCLDGEDARDVGSSRMIGIAELDVANFLASPRHSYWFLHNNDEIQKILHRTEEMLKNGGFVVRKEGQGIIVSFQDNFVEVHDGNASVVAWVLYRRLCGESTLWKYLEPNCTVKAVLVDRLYEDGTYWHPYVPNDVGCRDRLQPAPNDEKDKQRRKALTWDGTPVYFNDVSYFSGIDSSETIGEIANQLEKVEMVRDFIERIGNEKRAEDMKVRSVVKSVTLMKLSNCTRSFLQGKNVSK